ncbi:predicted protein [Naegleria gruberi]|uniref:Predicted protein n=1 Tax=Naegleria gruberi TaxID=5762 RepID=D2VI61_NAEGR|nr:uncharacterized protein NAEGRDRAFT_39446 [Naegleria gruberi]EFC43536.1 predicted protein [Naegleria gruberi]|eukprot:XP_002676280.1 predicted protein [Naegleria gruberi strain NEG-M]
MSVTPALRVKPVHKRDKKFRRFDAHKFTRLAQKTTWRCPHGIDNPLRRHYRGHGALPSSGFGTAKVSRFHDRKTRLIPYVVANAKDLEVLLMHNNKYAAVISAKTGAQKRKQIVERAKELDIKVLNATARLKTEETQ